MGEQNEEKTYDHSFILGEETRPKIQIFTKKNRDVTVKNSIFYKQYRQVLSAIAEHLLLCNRNGDPENLYSSWEFPNNIFVFAGERGSGKTSCMLTARELLCMPEYDSEAVLEKLFDVEDSSENGNTGEEKSTKNSDKIRKKKEELAIYENVLKKTSFYRCEVIDPLFFDSNHNILELFVGTLFRDLKKKKEEDPQYRNDGKSLLSRFADIKRIFPLLGRRPEFSDFDDLEQLKDLSASLDLKEAIRKLVQDYLKYVYEDEKGKLVLCIDDIDLDMKDGYGLVECIRRYLNMPELVILMAVKLEQLGNVIRIKYTKDFRPLLERYEREAEKENLRVEDNYNEVVNHIVERYVTKLLPLNQRIIMPSVQDLFDKDIQIFRKQGIEIKKVATLSPMKNGILEEIYKKTRLLFYNTKSQVNYIIPRNLREFCNLLHLLYNLDDVESHEGALPNIVHFKEYFYSVWCTNNLDKDGLFIMQKLRDILDYRLINQTVIKHLKRRFEILQNIGNRNSRDNRLSDNSMRELQNILDEENVMYNISLGDALSCLDWLDKVSYKEYDLKLLFAIKTFYTFSLYETFRKKEDIEKEKGKLSQKEVINKEVVTNNETLYGDIVSGNLLNSDYLNAVPYEKDRDKKESISRCRRVIDYEVISELIENTLENELKKESTHQIDYTSCERGILRKLVEFFLLTTSCVVEPKDKDSNSAFSQYRKRNEVYYEKKVKYNRKYVCFDILSVFYNLQDAFKCYNRFDNFIKQGSDNLWSNSDEYPLYADMLKYIKEHDSMPLSESENEMETVANKLIYKVSLRNIDILEQISYRLQRNRPDGSGDSVQLFKDMFANLADITISTYRNEKSEPDIKYDFFNVIKDFLHELSKTENEHYKKIFNRIYVDFSKENPSPAENKQNS